MRAPLNAPLVLAVVLVLVGFGGFGGLGGSPACAAAEKREIKAKNFTWTLPSEDWSFAEPEAGQVKDGYALGARHKDGTVTAWVRVAPAADLGTEELTREVQTAYTQGLTGASAGKVATGSLSGIAGHQIVIRGKKGGTDYWFNGLAMKQGDSLHQMLIEGYGGAEQTLGSEIDALRRGYRLIEGSGPEESPSVPTPLKEGEGGADASGDSFPSGGPKKEGRTAVFPSHNLRWTLPEGSPFAWTVVTTEEPKVGQLLIQARGSQARKADNAGEPTQNVAEVRLVVGPRHPGQTPDALVNASNVHQNFIKEVFQGKVDSGKTKIDPSRKVGNHTGASFTLVGGEDKLARYFIFVTVMLRDRQYEWRVVLEGGRDVLSAWGKPLGALFDGVEFPNIQEPVSGPLQVAGVGAFPSERGQSMDREIETPIAGGTAKKPKGVGDVPRQTGADPTLRLAWEARSADGMAYLYFDIRGWSVTDRAVAARSLEEWVKERETEWRTGAGSEAVTIAKGKTPWFDAAWGGAKGVGYRFTGTGAGGHPFVEQGWVVKSKNSVLVLRSQFGGANAEKVLDALWKAIKKGVKLG